MRSVHIIVLAAVLLLMANDAFAANDQFKTTKTVGNWEVTCSEEVCLVLLNKTNGAGDTTAVVKVDKATLKPENFGFVVAGSIKSKDGIVVQFVKTTIDSKNPKCAGDANGRRPVDCYDTKALENAVFNGSFSECDPGMCIAKVPGQFIGDENTPGRIDLLKHFENDDSVLIRWNSESGKLQSKLLDIAGFKAAYDTALSILSAKN
jgi:hypothetical protein